MHVGGYVRLGCLVRLTSIGQGSRHYRVSYSPLQIRLQGLAPARGSRCMTASRGPRSIGEEKGVSSRLCAT